MEEEVRSEPRSEHDQHTALCQRYDTLNVDHNLEKLRIIISDAEFFDDNINFNISQIQKSKSQNKPPPLRLTQNNKVKNSLSRTY